MKSLRIWILVLLAILLPIRGAVAAVMGCAPAMTMHSDAPSLPASPHDDAMAMTMSAPDGCDGDHGAAASSSHHDGGSSATGCGMCCDLCSLTPMPGIDLALLVSERAVSASWSEPLAADPSFQVDGPERPPRSI